MIVNALYFKLKYIEVIASEFMHYLRTIKPYDLEYIYELHSGAGGYVIVQEKLPNYVVPDLTDFKVRLF